ncbi:NTPase [bacterium BMS3Abin04]|nr:NTPase [bacterium BMS3Abin04]
MQNLYILTGPIKTGKSTKLLRWSETKENVAGILQYEVNGKRVIRDISSKQVFMLEDDNLKENQKIKVGKYSFNKNAFLWAQKKLEQSFRGKPDWLIIDEYGKLEIDNGGLEPAISDIINKSRKQNCTKIILVVRDYLKNDFLKKFEPESLDYKYFDFG